MGNQLVAIAPAQTFPVEHYLGDIPDLSFNGSLGNTRFMKVAKATRNNQTLVVKVFTIQDPSIDLKKEKKKLDDIQRALEECLNCLPFQQSMMTDRAGFLFRQYMKDSLYDRVSTRPFLTLVEKKWLAFQLLVALQQSHKHGICHGDIKMENVMVTSWNWLVLTDFASFKPTFLPEDNPADFSYFFDTSRRRTCYLAPERFQTRSIDALIADNQQLASGGLESGELLPSMDIFSAGCVFIELFTDGSVHAFSLSKLLAYRVGEDEPHKVFEKIEDEDIQELIKHMILKNPADRFSASEYLKTQTGKAFPNYFYTFMLDFMTRFSADPSMGPDTKIERIYNKIEDILSMLEDENSDFDSGGLVLICSLITSNLRSLKFAGTKSMALATLGKIAPHVKSEIILDRILPYIITQLSDRFPSVRISALACLIECTKSVKTVPMSDANIFPGYILETLVHLCHDRNDLVRAAFASNISVIALESARFLDIVMLHGNNPDFQVPMYEKELNALHESISQAVSVLLADAVNPVKQGLMENSVTQLAIFFGKLKANDILLSHMITFLNDKDDAQLRISFYDNIVGVAAFIGKECSPILLPLLQQGLSDTEEFVVARCIGAMASLTELDLLQKSALYELLKDTAPYLLHPNLWIRQATAGFLSSSAKHLDTVDRLVKLGNILEPFLKHKIVQMEQPYLIMANVHSPIPRQLYDTIVKASPSTLPKYFDYLEHRKTARSASKSAKELENSEVRKLQRSLSEVLTPALEDHLLSMRDKLVKLSQHKSVLKKSSLAQSFFSNGVIDIKALRNSGKDTPIRTSALVDMDPLYSDNHHFDHPSTPHVQTGNEEWNQMFGESKAMDLLGPVETAKEAKTCNDSGKLDSEKGDFAPCLLELDDLISYKRREYQEESRKRKIGDLSERKPSSNWKPKGVLVAHLKEHEGGIVKLAMLPGKTVFASASQDGCVRLWDCKKFEGKNVANRAHGLLASKDQSPLTCMAVDPKGEIIAFGAENGSICLNHITGSEIRTLMSNNSDEVDPPVELVFVENSNSPFLMYATAYGGIFGVDPRQPRPAFSCYNELRDGIQTAFAASQGDHSWAVSGTSSGKLICWDLRFLLPVVKPKHSAESRIRALHIPQKSQAEGSVLAAVQGNNEVGLWNIESQHRQLVLWASSMPILVTDQKHNSLSQSISALLSIQQPDMNVVLTAGTDMRIRYWNLSAPQESYIVAGGSNEVINPNLVSYKAKFVEGSEVIQEIHTKPKLNIANAPSAGMIGQSMDPNSNRPGLEPPSQGHLDWISSLTLCQASHWYLVSGSRDGVIKVWK